MKRSSVLSLSLLLALAGCAADTGGGPGGGGPGGGPGGGKADGADEMECPPEDPACSPPLHNLQELVGGAPRNESLRSAARRDETFPRRYTDLISLQSPMRNQASRGVCSIFATNALMEHLYISEGTILQPDFSEQFLQWSAKVEVGSFPNTSGSNARSNLQSISEHGIVVEEIWPYETAPWGPSNDPMCTGDNQPTICHTNGNPPESALMAARWRLPGGRWVNSTERSLKAHMKNTRTGVVVGMAFFYQSWNHGRSPLPTNAQYQRQGYVLYPNDDDKRMSQEPSRSAGHAILLIGWDDDLRVQRVNADGTPMVDAMGNAVYDQGFFLFKNSWGTSRFGVENEFGAGYGWISYRYISEYGTAYGSAIPRCNDASPDCNDPLCRARGLCDMPMPEAREYTSTMAVPIPDDDAMGIASTIDVPDMGTIRTASITVDITHPYRGDLVIRLDRADAEPIVLLDREGGSADDVQRSWDLPQLAGVEASGPWTLEVVDTAGQDIGTLNRWTIRLETERGSRP